MLPHADLQTVKSYMKDYPEVGLINHHHIIESVSGESREYG